MSIGKKYEIQVCLGSSCFSRGNRDLIQFIKDYLKRNHLDDMVLFKGARCMGHCSKGPVVLINNILIEEVSVALMESILDKEFGALT